MLYVYGTFLIHIAPCQGFDNIVKPEQGKGLILKIEYSLTNREAYYPPYACILMLCSKLAFFDADHSNPIDRPISQEGRRGCTGRQTRDGCSMPAP